jgi:hypothetical protein
VIRQFWLAVTARLRLRRLAEPTWWRWRKQWHRWNVQRTRWLQAQSGHLDGHRKNVSVALRLAAKSAGIALTAAVLLLATEIIGKLLPRIGWDPIQHLGATRESKDYESLVGVLIGAEATLLA